MLFYDDLPVRNHSAWIPVTSIGTLESVFHAYWKIITHHMPKNILSEVYGTMLDDPKTGTELLAFIMLNQTQNG